MVEPNPYQAPKVATAHASEASAERIARYVCLGGGIILGLGMILGLAAGVVKLYDHNSGSAPSLLAWLCAAASVAGTALVVGSGVALFIIRYANRPRLPGREG